MESEPIRTEVDGITFLSTGHYYEGINQWVAHKLKEGDIDCYNFAAKQMAKMLPKNAVLVPILLKTEDIHPPKTGISVHFSDSLT